MTEDHEEVRRPRLFLYIIGLSCLVFVLAVTRHVLPIGSSSADGESLVELRERLAEERATLRRELNSELDEWKSKNRDLESQLVSLEEAETR